MPRAKPPRLYLRKESRHDPGRWLILDRGRQISTGASGADREQAHAALAAYLAQQHQPAFESGHPSGVLIVDALSAYAESHGPSIAIPENIGYAALRLAAFFKAEKVSGLTEQRCRDFVAWRVRQPDPRYTLNPAKAPRVSAATARRELVVLSAALNWCWRNGKLDRPIQIVLPSVAGARERHLTRRETARLLGAALGFYRQGGRVRRDHARINRHLARFILIGLYTGTRHGAILSLQWRRNRDGGHVDLGARVIYRRAETAIETGKRRPPLPIPPRLLPHLARWRRLTNADHVITWRDAAIAGQLRKSFKHARMLAGLDAGVTPHILRHTCATWLLQAGVSIFDVAGVLGCSEAVVRETYGHHAQDHLAAALNVFSRARA